MNWFHRHVCRSARWRRRLQRTLLPWALEGVELGDDVLEIGPGPGLTTDLLRLRTRHLTALEVEPAAAESLQKRLDARNSDGCPVRVIQADGAAMPFDAATFSAVVAFTMLHHVPTPAAQDRLLAEARRVLRPGGTFAGFDGVDSLPFRLIHIGDTYNPIDPDALAARLQAAGFEKAPSSAGAGDFVFARGPPNAECSVAKGSEAPGSPSRFSSTALAGMAKLAEPLVRHWPSLSGHMLRRRETRVIRLREDNILVIRISGPAKVACPCDTPLSSETVRELHSAISKDSISTYFDPEFGDMGITGGTVKLVHDEAGRQFRVISEFRSPDKLAPAMLQRLVSETIGQWSDGIGEGCFDDLARRLNVTIDLSPIGQERELVVEQIDDGKPVQRSATAVVKAAREGDLPKMMKLLDEGADMETRIQGCTALHLAVLGGHAEVSLELIRRGADLKARDGMGEDPLMLAALSNRITDADAARIAEALLERGADVHGPRGCDANPLHGEYTPLHMAKSRKKSKLAAVLQRFGATS
jgi:SAM-dependent methyltransferase